ncbi:MAG TPA: cupredoxin domain-containing protein [Thermoleophilaceae bacterium]|nr:cupredoxin domain-containing protein [Thermoleophilaceae bacterium]
MKRLVIIAPVAVLAIAGCGSGNNSTPTAPSSAPKTAAVQKDAVTLDEFSIKPTLTTLKAGKVEFDVKNAGKMSHEFLVIETTKPAAKLGTGRRVPEKGNIGETGDVEPGASKKLVLNLKKGHYDVICNDPGHYMSGMHRDLTVS